MKKLIIGVMAIFTMCMFTGCIESSNEVKPDDSMLETTMSDMTTSNVDETSENITEYTTENTTENTTEVTVVYPETMTFDESDFTTVTFVE